jgi:hypothetical protein
MNRTLVCLGAFATVAVLTTAWSAAPPPAQKPSPPPPAATKTTKAKKVSLARKLQQEIEFPGVDDPKSALIEALDALAKKHQITFDINERAFKWEMLNDVARTEIANPNPILPMKTRLATALQKILDRIPVPSGATYLVHRDVIEITTGQFASTEIQAGHKNLIFTVNGGSLRGWHFPRVHPDFKQTPLIEALDALADESDVNIVLDNSVGEKKANLPVDLRARNIPLDTVVLLLAGAADLRMLQLDNVLYVTTPARAASLQKDHVLRRPINKRPEDVLER